MNKPELPGPRRSLQRASGRKKLDLICRSFTPEEEQRRFRKTAQLEEMRGTEGKTLCYANVCADTGCQENSQEKTWGDGGIPKPTPKRDCTE